MKVTCVVGTCVTKHHYNGHSNSNTPQMSPSGVLQHGVLPTTCVRPIAIPILMGILILILL